MRLMGPAGCWRGVAFPTSIWRVVYIQGPSPPHAWDLGQGPPSEKVLCPRELDMALSRFCDRPVRSGGAVDVALVARHLPHTLWWLSWGGIACG